MQHHADQARPHELKRIIYWSAGILVVMAGFGLSLWAKAGTAVFFDRIASGFANCF